MDGIVYSVLVNGIHLGVDMIFLHRCWAQWHASVGLTHDVRLCGRRRLLDRFRSNLQVIEDKPHDALGCSTFAPTLKWVAGGVWDEFQKRSIA